MPTCLSVSGPPLADPARRRHRLSVPAASFVPKARQWTAAPAWTQGALMPGARTLPAKLQLSWSRANKKKVLRHGITGAPLFRSYRSDACEPCQCPVQKFRRCLVLSVYKNVPSLSTVCAQDNATLFDNRLIIDQRVKLKQVLFGAAY